MNDSLSMKELDPLSCGCRGEGGRERGREGGKEGGGGWNKR